MSSTDTDRMAYAARLVADLTDSGDLHEPAGGGSCRHALPSVGAHSTLLPEGAISKPDRPARGWLRLADVV